MDGGTCTQPGEEPEPRQEVDRAIIGTRIDRYLVHRKIGAGAMGVVFAARDTELDRDVALKVLRAADSRARPRLLREAQALARINHPAVVAIHDVGAWQERVWLAMELVDGSDLRTWLRERSPSWRDIVQSFVQAGEGLAAVHAEGLVHRDFKPANLMVTDDGRVKVMDFGLALIGDGSRETGRGCQSPANMRRSQRHNVLTRPGAHAGTPAYMAPERFMGIANASTDQYSFCVALWEALFEQLPFSGASISALQEAVMSDRRSKPTGRHPVPGWLRRACARGLSAEPADRWPSMTALVQHLRQGPRKRLRMFAGLATVALVGGTATGVSQLAIEDECRDGSARVAEVWNPERRQRVGDRLSAIEAPYSKRARDTVLSALDEHSRSWAAQWERTCEAVQALGEGSSDRLAHTMQCLTTHRGKLAAAVDAFESADAAVVAHAREVLDAVPDPASCALVEGPPPPAPTQRPTIDDARGALATVRTLRVSGKLTEALAVADRVAEEATRLGYGPLVTETRLERGTVLSELDRADEAEVELVAALQSALRWDQDRIALEATMTLAHVVGTLDGRHEAGLAYLDSARGLWSRLGEDPASEGDLANTLAGILSAQGRFKEARASYQEADRLWSVAYDATDPRRLVAVHNLAGIQQQLGETADAERTLRGLLEDRIGAVGEAHPEVAATRLSLGAVLDDLGRYPAAEAQYRDAIATWSASVGPSHRNVARARNNLAGNLLLQEQLEAAQSEYEAALAIYEEIGESSHPEFATMQVNLAMVYRRLERYEDAEGLQRRALSALRRELSDEHPSVARARYEVGNTANLRGEHAVAETELRMAVDSLTATLGAEHPVVLMANAELVTSLLGQGKDEEGHALRRAVVTATRAALANDHPVRVDIESRLATGA